MKILKKTSFLLMALILMLVVVSCGGNNPASEKKAETQEELLVYSGAGLRKPMDEIGKLFEEKYNIKIKYSYAGSAQNLNQIELTQKGDAYIPGALHYIEVAEEKGFVKNKKNVVYHIPVIGVPKGNPANITKLEDLAKPGVRVILGDERSAAIGKVTQKLLEKNNLLEAVEKNVVTKDATVNEVVVHTSMGQGDACIIWEDNIFNVEELEIVKIPDEINMIKTIPIGSLTFSKKPELAEKFVDFVASEEGKKIFEKHGFKRVE